ncbi:MAG: hypothetical protein SVW02_03855 [Candidatus Nanohaloarchaea archaeon]|nr:hypothetical protein [Candidatus Nanohaloarchaea archaeon]
MAVPGTEEPVGNTYRRRIRHGFVDVEVTGVRENGDVAVYDAEVLDAENAAVSTGDEIRVAGHFLQDAYDPLDEI